MAVLPIERPGRPGRQHRRLAGRAALGCRRLGRVAAAVEDRAIERLGGRLIDGVVSVVVSEERAQLHNRAIAEARLAKLVADAIAPPPARRHPTRPTKGSVERRLNSKRRTSQIKQARRRPID